MQTDPQSGPIRVLLAEDESLVAALTRAELESRGYTVVGIAPDGVKVVELVASLRPDVVVMDLEMPLQDGIGAAAAIQEACPTPIVILTAHPDFTNLSKAVATGVGAFVVKPPLAEELERAITIAIARHADLMALQKSNRELAQRNAELRETHGRIQAIGDNLPDGYIYQTQCAPGKSAQFTFVSAGAKAVHGIEPAAILADPGVLAKQVLAEDRASWVAAQEKSYRELTVFSAALRFQREGGPIRWLQLNSSPTRLPNGTVVWDGIALDVTARKQAELDQTMRAKLESTGVLAGGIAHDFNNLLTVVSLNLGVLSGADVDRNTARDLLAASISAVSSAKELTTQLLTFATGGSPRREIRALGPLLKASQEFALRGGEVRGECEVADDLWPAEIDGDQIAQAVRNVVLNAGEATAPGGHVLLRAENISVAAGATGDLRPGDYVHLCVSDQGAGIPADVLPKIFDPYFSTKQRGAQKGMGLGLTTCRSIVEHHGGKITVETAPQSGTSVHIYLPARRPAAPAPTPETLQPSPGRRARKLLVMDDDLALRRTIQLTLEYKGYEVAIAADGDEAIACYRQARETPKPFDVVLLDLTVAIGKGGAATLVELLQIEPAVRAVVMSGYANDQTFQAWQRAGFVGSLTKPFAPETLENALQKAMATVAT